MTQLISAFIKGLLELLANYQNITAFFPSTARPGMLDFTGKAKWDAWDAKKGQFLLFTTRGC